MVLAFRLAVRPLLGTAALIAAVALILSTIPGIYNGIYWREKQYRQLEQIHAGFRLAFAESLIGTPTTVTELPAVKNDQFIEYIFVRRDHYVQLVVNRADTIMLYSVVSCDKDFQPRFQALEGTLVQLQREPLSMAASFDPDTAYGMDRISQEAVNADRYLNFMAGSTGSTPEHYIEAWSASIATRNRSYYVGINTLCMSLDQAPGRYFEYQGSPDEAPQIAKNLREHLAANMYAETAPGTGLPDDIDRFGTMLSFNAWIGPLGFNLPPSFDGRGNTRETR